MVNTVLFDLLDLCFLFAAIAFVVMFYKTIAIGKTMAGDGDGMREYSISSFKCRKQEHRWYANGGLVALALAVLFIEIKVRLGGFADRAPGLLLVHLFFAVSFFYVLLTLRFKITGTKNLALHKKIAYRSLALFIGTAITGILLFF